MNGRPAWKYDLESSEMREFLEKIAQGARIADAAKLLGVTDRTINRRMVADSKLRDLVRQAIDRRDASKLQLCGSAASYERGCRCEQCRAAHALRHSGQRKRRKSYSDDRVPHGTGGYSNYGCRCVKCTSAHLAKLKREQSRRVGDVDHTPHGTRSGYKAWACRCEECYSAYIAVDGPRLAETYRKTLDNADHHGQQWTGPEMEIAAREDLSARQAALMLGRTIYAVGRMRKLLKVDPRYINAAGVVSGSSSKSQTSPKGIG